MAVQTNYKPQKVALDAKKVIAVASGKGGVGKSTVAVNLALAIAETGKKVGILDADIYGPNIPLMLGLENQSAFVTDGKLAPIEAFGLKVMSVGFITQQEKALIWRGPLANRMIEQLLTDVHWGELDVMIIDLPPGTGDVPLSITQKVKLDGGVVVTTPQEASVADVKKMLDMFTMTKINVMGIVENMKYLQCSGCSKRTELYPNSGGKSLTEMLGQKLLAELPFDPQMGVKNGGKPYFISNSDSEIVKIYQQLWQQIEKLL
jgi:ATP-binding protein involved in chromosome partitioning